MKFLMKFQVTFHDPDTLQDSLEEACRESVAGLLGLTDKEKDRLIESRVEKAFEDVEKWLDCREYVTIEVDTDNGTAMVVKND